MPVVSDAPLSILHLVSYPLYSGPLPPTTGLALAQRRLGHTVYLAYDRKRGDDDAFEEAATPRLRRLGLDPPLGLTLSTKSSALELLSDVRALRALITHHGVQVLHAHQSHDHALLALVGGGALRVRTVHANRTLSRRLGQRWLNGRADAFVVRHAHARAQLALHSGIDSERVAVIGGAIDAELFMPPSDVARREARVRFGLPADTLVLGHVALIAERGQEELVDAVASLRETALHLLFVGRGEAEVALRARVERAGLSARVHFTGYLRGDDLLLAYAAMDAAFVAQPGNDASARAALEAMACGLPLLAVQVDALAELVDADVGYPVVDRQPAAIAAALSQLIADGQQRQERARRGRERVRTERTFEREARATVDFYRRARVMTGRRGSASRR
ncbi:MAG: glycosyltransferase family 4 protein [Myxococcota bacterium]